MHDFHPTFSIHTKRTVMLISLQDNARKSHCQYFSCLIKCTPAVISLHACYYHTWERWYMSPKMTLTIVFPILMQCAYSNWCFLNAPLSSVWNHSSECLLSSCSFLSLHRPCSKLAVNIVTLVDWTSLPSEQHMDVWHWEAPQVCQHVFMSACSGENFFFLYLFLQILTLHIHPTKKKKINIYPKMKIKLVSKVEVRCDTRDNTSPAQCCQARSRLYLAIWEMS